MRTYYDPDDDAPEVSCIEREMERADYLRTERKDREWEETAMNKNDPKGAIGATKCPLHLIPPASMEATAWVLASGAEKYGIRNWRDARIKSSTYESAIMRHLNAYRDGEDQDPESGFMHLSHISANVAILLDAIRHGVLEDDRNLTETKNP